MVLAMGVDKVLMTQLAACFFTSQPVQDDDNMMTVVLHWTAMS